MTGIFIYNITNETTCSLVICIRSLLGNRDSEMAIFIEDTEMISSYMDGEPVCNQDSNNRNNVLINHVHISIKLPSLHIRFVCSYGKNI